MVGGASGAPGLAFLAARAPGGGARPPGESPAGTPFSLVGLRARIAPSPLGQEWSGLSAAGAGAPDFRSSARGQSGARLPCVQPMRLGPVPAERSARFARRPAASAQEGAQTGIRQGAARPRTGVDAAAADRRVSHRCAAQQRFCRRLDAVCDTGDRLFIEAQGPRHRRRSGARGGIRPACGGRRIRGRHRDLRLVADVLRVSVLQSRTHQAPRGARHHAVSAGREPRTRLFGHRPGDAGGPGDRERISGGGGVGALYEHRDRPAPAPGA